jgi:Delta7-sterol 5-desaturase
LLNRPFWFYWVVFCGLILVRYFLIAGGTHWFFYSFRTQFARQTVRLRAPSWRSMRKDMELSVLSGVIFALCAAIVLSGYDLGVTRLYADIHAYGLWYLGVSYVSVLILQDAYFYFVHRLCHHPSLFKWLHQGHHRSGHPTPWTSFAFDPPEALLQGLFLVGIVFVLPLHYTALIAVLMTMTVWAVVNHLGLELLPVSFPHHWLGRWCIGPAHHSIHHRKYNLHYGLYFTFWDKLLGTNDPSYEQTFDASLKRSSSSKDRSPAG